MQGTWKPTEFKDDYREKLMEIIEEKATNGKVAAAPVTATRATNVVDLVAVLQKSIAESKKKPKLEEN